MKTAVPRSATGAPAAGGLCRAGAVTPRGAGNCAREHSGAAARRDRQGQPLSSAAPMPGEAGGAASGARGTARASTAAQAQGHPLLSAAKEHMQTFPAEAEEPS
ncbi:hypothetical protein GCM10009801_65400 [Streptomyces albiaxialis]|uniref:Uncharacterized protein n=1 Tax=Streptomyces albiaxialis TaxID=329523 RepID=A0ABP5IBT4_9ACTN